MYVGRFVVVAPDRAAYRVSSRSFPNRRIVAREGGTTLTVGPTDDAPETDNPYISYNCVREVDGTVVVGNGSHVDPITEKIGLGYPARDALAESLLALDYEKDDYDTPRIAGVVGGESYIGTVRKDALLVEQVTEPTLVATYEEDSPTAFDLDGETSAEIAGEVYDHEFEHAVCAAGVTRDEDGIETAIENGE
ncbi:IMP cyclohydrolase [Halorientalis pallida]|uniref:IMP cyclohydrolase n=1 Tax=Halorientalis pallida TaxID=2479928 RepID=A0A498L0P4_9EURY|nr:IMP cyclohydrolase [Halorientalis pallida]RXK50403.1 IMP cyclohydrolase [Halorientalis pallida]